MRKDLVLIVDDDEINRIILTEYLTEDYNTLEAADGQEALELIERLKSENDLPSAILLDVLMPKMDGFSVLKHLKSDTATSHIPVLFITAEDGAASEARGIREGAADYIPKPFSEEVVKLRLRHNIELMHYQHNLEQLVEQKTDELSRTYGQILEVLATFVEYRSLESGQHIRRTSLLTEVLIDRLTHAPEYTDFRELLPPPVAQAIIRATALHDIGKIGIEDRILLKPGKLTAEEFEEMKKHTVIGGQMIDSMITTLGDSAQYLTFCREICLNHHERWDGNGYPFGLSTSEIPLSARMLSLVDVYDALSNPRVYKPAFPHEKALEIILEGRGTQFDPVLVDAFLSVADACKDLESVYKD